MVMGMAIASSSTRCTASVGHMPPAVPRGRLVSDQAVRLRRYGYHRPRMDLCRGWGLRRQGALEAAAIPIDDELVRFGDGGEGFGHAASLGSAGHRAARTAIFAVRNAVTMGAVRALAERQLSHTVGLLGFDDFPLAGLLTPPVSVLTQDIPALSTRAAEILFARIAGGSSPRLPSASSWNRQC
jgi:hypothetical protein